MTSRGSRSCPVTNLRVPQGRPAGLCDSRGNFSPSSGSGERDTVHAREVRRYAPPVSISEESGSGPNNPTASDDVQYLAHVVKTIRGREASTVSKLQSQGWEFVSETQGTLRTELTFRRVKPKDPFRQFGRAIANGWAAFRRLDPKVQWGALALLTAVIAVPLIGMLVGDDTAEPRASRVAASTATAAEPSATPTTPDAEPTATPTPASVSPRTTPTKTPVQPVVTDITVDDLVDKINGGMSGMNVGDRYRFTGVLVRPEFWTIGATGEFSVLVETKTGSDLIVFVEQSDADGWEDGARVEMVVEDVERTINGETSHGWFKAQSVKMISRGTN